MRRWLGFLLVALLALAPGRALAGELRIYVFDVGQGASTLIVAPSGKTVLIDAGPPEAAPRLRARLEQLLTAPIDVVLLTHPHLDHLGGMTAALDVRGAQLFVDSAIELPSASQSALQKYLDGHAIRMVNATAGKSFDLGSGAQLQLLGPVRPALGGTASDANANSVAAKLTYGKRTFLFMADGEAEAEAALLKQGKPLAADVLEVGHHGGRTAASAAFLQVVKPTIAIISAGAGNALGLPNRAPIDRLEAMKARVLRTDLDGEVRIVSDGKSLVVRTGSDSPAPPIEVATAAELPLPEPAPPAHAKATRSSHEPRPKEIVMPVDPPPTHGAHVVQAKAGEGASPAKGSHYVASKNSDVFHLPDCQWARRIKPENLVSFPTRQGALDSGRSPANCCHP